MKIAAAPPTMKISRPMSARVSVSAKERMKSTRIAPKISSTAQNRGLRMMSAIFSAMGRALVMGKNSVRSVYSWPVASSRCRVVRE